MGSYVQAALTPGENIIHQGKVSVWSLAPLIIIGAILTPFIIGPVFWLIAFIRWWTTELAITNKRVIAKFGLISRDTVEIGIKKVESIQIKQGILGRIFGFGSVIISGAGNPQAPIPGISSPMDFRRAFIDTQEQP